MEYKVLMIIKTLGIEYDDRLRKECNSISNLGHRVKIIALEDTNLVRKGKLNNLTNYKTISLLTRKIFPQRKFLAFKLIEMNLKFMYIIVSDKANIVWIHNSEMVGLVPFLKFLKKIGFIKKVVWDQHELITKKSVRKKYIKNRLEKANQSVDVLISANNARNKIVRNEFNLNNSCRVIENFVDKEFKNIRSEELPEDTTNWLEDKKYIIAQSGASRSRYFLELCDAIMRLRNLKLLVIGPYKSEQIEYLNKKYKESYKEWIFFTGMVDQMKIPIYLDKAYASIIMYSRDDSLNLVYCAPNRLYQALCRGIPIIVGDNPPLKEIVETYGNGVVMLSDGKNVEDIVNGINKLENNYSNFKNNALSSIDTFLWENQDETISEIID